MNFGYIYVFGYNVEIVVQNIHDKYLHLYYKKFDMCVAKNDIINFKVKVKLCLSKSTHIAVTQGYSLLKLYINIVQCLN